MDNILIAEWNNKCEQFLKDHQHQHKWNEEQCLFKLWDGIMSTKYLISTLIEKCIEVLPKLTDESEISICFRINENPAFTMDMVLAYPELQWECNFLVANI